MNNSPEVSNDELVRIPKTECRRVRNGTKVSNGDSLEKVLRLEITMHNSVSMQILDSLLHTRVSARPVAPSSKLTKTIRTTATASTSVNLPLVAIRSNSSPPLASWKTR
jgi:hypothetical protein